MTRFVGIDLHKKVAQICILNAQGSCLEELSVPVSRSHLLDFCKKTLKPEDQLVLEATTNTWAAVDLLEPFVGSISVSNPLQTKAIACAKVKTDKVDARVLAHLLRCDYLPKVWQPDPLTRRLRSLTNRRAALVSQRTAIKNRIHATLAQRLIDQEVYDLFVTKGLAWLRNLKLDEDGQLALEADLRLLEALESEIQQMETHMAKMTYSQEDVRLLMTLPGVSMIVAVGLLAAWGDVKRFKTASKAAAYLGLVPSTRQSANKCYHGPITKRGPAKARWLLIQAAQQLMRFPGPHGYFFAKSKRRKNHNVAVCASARKLAVIAWHLLQNRKPYRYALPKPTAAKLAKVRILATGEKRHGGWTKGRKRSELKDQSQRMLTVPTTQSVCLREALPATKQLNDIPPGERKFLSESHGWPHFEKVCTQRKIPRNKQPIVSEAEPWVGTEDSKATR